METTKKYIEILTLILISCSPLISQVMKGLLLIIIILLNIKYLKATKKNMIISLFIFVTYFVITGFLDINNMEMAGEYSILNFYYPLCFFLGYILSEKYNINVFFNIFEKIIFITACFSIGGMIIYNFFPSIVFSLPNYVYYDTVHKTAFIFNILVADTGIIMRNAGIASEPGLYQLFLNLAVFSYMKFGKKQNIIKLIIYGIAIFGTQSTTGLIIYMFLIWQIIKKYKYSWIPFIFIIFFLSDFIYNELIYQINYKLIGSSSFEIRLEPMLNAFKEGSSHVFGLGNSGYNYQYKDLVVGSFDSFSQIFIRYGYIGLILLIISLIKISTKSVLLFLILSFTFLSQSVWFVPIITPFYFFYIGNNKNESNNYLYGGEFF